MTNCSVPQSTVINSLTEADVLAAMSRLKVPADDAKSYAPRVLSFFKECTSGHAHDWGVAETECRDSLTRHRDLARHALGVITRADPYVRPAGAGEAARLCLRIPGDAPALGISAAEMTGLRFAIARTNALLADGFLKLDAFGNILVPGEPQLVEVLSRLGGGRGTSGLKGGTSGILPVVVTTHWWGICICLTLDEVVLLTSAIALVGLGLISFPITEILGIALEIIAAGLSAYLLFSKLTGLNTGLCFYSTPLGTFVVPS